MRRTQCKYQITRIQLRLHCVRELVVRACSRDERWGLIWQKRIYDIWPQVRERCNRLKMEVWLYSVLIAGVKELADTANPYFNVILSQLLSTYSITVTCIHKEVWCKFFLTYKTCGDRPYLTQRRLQTWTRQSKSTTMSYILMATEGIIPIVNRSRNISSWNGFFCQKTSKCWIGLIK